MNKGLISAVIALSLLCFSVSAHAEDAQENPPFVWPPAYSVSMDWECQGHAIPETYSVDGQNSRTEMKLSSGGSYITIIHGGDKGEIVHILNGRVFRSPVGSNPGQQPLAIPAFPFPADSVWSSVGKETVDGKPAVKYKVTATFPSGLSSSFYIWLSEDGKTPLRGEYNDKKVKITSYKPGPQNPKLFEAPDKSPESTPGK